MDCTITSDNYNDGKLVGEYFRTQNKNAQLVIMMHETAKYGHGR